MYDPENARKDHDFVAPKALPEERDEDKGRLREAWRSWKDMPLAVKAGALAIPLGIAGDLAAGTTGAITGSISTLLGATSVSEGYTTWRKKRDQKRED